MNRIFVSLAFTTLVFLPFSVSAGPIIRSGETITIDASQSLEGDFYGFGSTVNISGQGDNDVYVAGGTIMVNAPIQQDLTIIGGVIQVHGDVGDDVRVVGGEVTIAKPVHGDVVVLGGTLTILSTAQIDGDVLFMGNDLIVEGTVTGGVHGTVKKARLNSEIKGNVSLDVQELFTIGNNAKLDGSVSYTSTHEVVRAQNAVIANSIQHTNVRETDEGKSTAQAFGYAVSILLFVALVLYMVGRNIVVEITQRSFERIGISGLIGIGVFIGLPLVAVLFCVSMLGALVGFILLTTYLLLLMLAFALAPVFFGYALQKIILKRSEVTLYTICIGVVIFVVSNLSFVLGGFLMFFCFIVTLGSLSVTLYHIVRDS